MTYLELGYLVYWLRDRVALSRGEDRDGSALRLVDQFLGLLGRHFDSGVHEEHDLIDVGFLESLPLAGDALDVIRERLPPSMRRWFDTNYVEAGG